MDIVIISQYLRNIENLEGNNSRFIYLANLLSENKGSNVEIITSQFMHNPKKHAEKIAKPANFKLTAVIEPGYKKNICLKRFFSHKVLSKNIKNYLNKRKKPDCIYCAIPSLDVADVAAEYCKKNDVRFIIDIQDLWPEAFKMVFNVPLLKDIVFLPLTLKANKIYKQADDIIAVSQTYVDRAMCVNKKCRKGIPVFLGTKLLDFDSYACKNLNIFKNNTKELGIVYREEVIDNATAKSIIDVLFKIKQSSGYCLNFLAIGNLKEKDNVLMYANEKNIDCVFKDKLIYPHLLEYLKTCDIAINFDNCKNENMAVYTMSGLPIINIGVDEKFENLVKEYGAGVTCDCIENFYDSLKNVLDNIELRNIMRENSKKLFEDKFQSNDIYISIVRRLIHKKENDPIRIAYVGTLGASYDISVVISALRKMDTDDLLNIEFIVMGNGPRKEEFIKEAENLPIYFTGNIPYPEMVWILSRCDIAVNPIAHGAAQSIINKHGDYAMAGLPVISTQESYEYYNLVEEYQMGFNCENGNINMMKDKILDLCNNAELRRKLGNNARRCAREKFDRTYTYVDIVNYINKNYIT